MRWRRVLLKSMGKNFWIAQDDENEEHTIA